MVIMSFMSRDEHGMKGFVRQNAMSTNRGSSITGNIFSDFYQAHEGGNVTLYVESVSQNLSRVEFYDGSIMLGEDNSYPYEFTAQNLSLGIHDFYGKVFSGMEFGLTNVIDIQVGEQVPFENNLVSIPGTIETGKFDAFEGGVGQGISYYDNTQAWVLS